MASSDCATKWDVAAVKDDVRAVKRDIELLSQRVGTLPTSAQYERGRTDLYCDLYLLFAAVAVFVSFVLIIVAASRPAA